MAETATRAEVWLRALVARLRAKGPKHWITAGIVLIVAFFANPSLDRYLNLETLRYRLFQWLAERQPDRPVASHVKLVLIRDDDYWRGKIPGRRPIDRNYLAEIVDVLDRAEAAVIALDFDMKLPDPSDQAVAEGYKEETDTLIRTIIRAAENRRHIVLSKDIRGRGPVYALSPDIYQLYGLCTRLYEDGSWAHAGVPGFPLSEVAESHIQCGYIAVPHDMRLLPPRLEIEGGGRLDSFALNVARATEPDVSARLKDRPTYASYIRLDEFDEAEGHYGYRDQDGKFERSKRVFAASEIRARDPFVLQYVAHKTVIVGGSWSQLQYGRGATVDMHPTPLGDLVGAVIHANFAEAMLGTHRYRQAPEWIPSALEIFFGLLAMGIFALFAELWPMAAALAGLSVFLLFMQWAMLSIFGVFFEAFLPVFGLWLHAMGERVIH
jgi:CHASE2 domain-containing sensor protein